MSERIVISTDCVCDLPESVTKKLSINVVPFYVSVNNIRFKDIAEVDSTSLMDYLESEEDIIASLPATIDEYRSHFRELTREKDVTVIHISVSKNLSSAYTNAVAATKGMDNVYVVDSGLFSHGLGLFVITAAELAKRNATIDIIFEELQKARNKISCSFVLKSTRYVANNNRLNQTLSHLIDLFNIKPILKLKHNEIKVGICFSRNKLSYARKYIKKTLRNKRRISTDVLFITVSGCTEEFQQFVYQEATKDIQWKRIYVQDVSATTLCNIGMESIGIMFYSK